MKKYYIIRSDGSSIFTLPYPEDFCFHCLMLLQNDGQRYKLLSSEELNVSLSAFKLELPTQTNLRPVALLGAKRDTPNSITGCLSEFYLTSL